MSPGFKLLVIISLGDKDTDGSGSIASRLDAFRVIAPVCQCSNCLPVVNIIEKSSSGSSSGFVTSALTNFPLPEVVGNLSPSDIMSNNLKPGDMIKVSTRRGSIQIRVRQDSGIPNGVLFIPFCYNEAAANLLTNSALDPYGKIPEFKYCAARIEQV